MPPEDINFQAFFAAKIKDRGVSIKKLSEATGIAPAYLEAMAHGRFDDLPSASGQEHQPSFIVLSGTTREIG